jgi:hypothetical protein
MWGDNVGALRIKTKSISGIESSVLWSRSYNYGDSWNIGQVQVSSSGSYQVIFEGVVDASWLGDIAIGKNYY